MTGIEVRGEDETTVIFTVTDRDQAPWGRTNTTIYIPPQFLPEVVGKLQARLQEVQQLQRATPALSVGAKVQIRGHMRHGQRGTVVEIRPKEARLQQRTGAAWAYTVAFADNITWTYTGDELEHSA